MYSKLDSNVRDNIERNISIKKHYKTKREGGREREREERII